MKRPTRFLRRKGATLVEVLTASTISVLVLAGAYAALLSGSWTWLRGSGALDANASAQRAVRKVASELRQAMSVTVDGNGLGLSYRMPVIDGNGNYTVPPIWDNVTRRIELNGTNLNIVTGGTTKRIASGVILTDPLSSGGTGSYVIFSPGIGTITRQVTVQLVVRKDTLRTKTTTSRNRETVFLRNIPELIR
jgi:hypothetical protein